MQLFRFLCRWVWLLCMKYKNQIYLYIFDEEKHAYRKASKIVLKIAEALVSTTRYYRQREILGSSSTNNFFHKIRSNQIIISFKLSYSCHCILDATYPLGTAVKLKIIYTYLVGSYFYSNSHALFSVTDHYSPKKVLRHMYAKLD